MDPTDGTRRRYVRYPEPRGQSIHWPLLQFLSDWLARDPGRLGHSLGDFIGLPAYGTAQLRQNLNWFVFLLGGSDGESLFGLAPQ
jgi:hypothetical protein